MRDQARWAERHSEVTMATKLVVAAVSMMAVAVLALTGCSPLQRPKADKLELKTTKVFAQVPSASASPASTPAKSVSTDWYGLGQEFTATAVKDGITPASLEGDPANHWDASRPASSWCADLSYPVTGTLPANLGALLAQLQASESGQAVTKFDNGCEDGYAQAFEPSSASGAASAGSGAGVSSPSAASPSTPLSSAASQVEQDGYPLIGQTTVNGYWIALGQDDSGNEELVETWPSNLQAQEEFAQYHNALMLNGLNDAREPEGSRTSRSLSWWSYPTGRCQAVITTQVMPASTEASLFKTLAICR